MRAVDPAARISFEPKSSWPGLETPPVSDVVGLAKRLADRNEHSKVAYGTEAGLYALAGIPAVVLARARSSRRTRPTSTLPSRSSKPAAPSSSGSSPIRAGDLLEYEKNSGGTKFYSKSVRRSSLETISQLRTYKIAVGIT
jgi:hypothetical protein